jgi:hypothetical protein
LYYGFTEDGVPYDKLPYLDTPQCQYQWNDFHVGNGVQENDERRGGYIVGSDVLDEFLGAVGLNVIFHAHSPNRDEFIPGRELLVFSAGGHEGSNYSTFQNRGYYTVDLAVPITDVAVARQHKVV